MPDEIPGTVIWPSGFLIAVWVCLRKNYRNCAIPLRLPFMTKPEMLRTYGLPVSISRCSNNYGPYHFPEKLIPLMIANALNDKPLPVYGKGENVRDWLYVEDHCRAIDLIIHNGRVGEVYNVGGHNEKRNIDVVKTILRIMGKPETLITHVKDRAGHDLRYAIDPTKIHNELGWSPETTFDEGIKKTVDWYMNNKQWWEDIINGEYQNYYEKMYSNR